MRHGSSATFEATSSYYRVARQSLPFYTAVARLGFKRRGTAVLKSNLIRSILFATAVARRVKRASASGASFLGLEAAKRATDSSHAVLSRTKNLFESLADCSLLETTTANSLRKDHV